MPRIQLSATKHEINEKNLNQDMSLQLHSIKTATVETNRSDRSLAQGKEQPQTPKGMYTHQSYSTDQSTRNIHELSKSSTRTTSLSSQHIDTHTPCLSKTPTGLASPAYSACKDGDYKETTPSTNATNSSSTVVTQKLKPMKLQFYRTKM